MKNLNEVVEEVVETQHTPGAVVAIHIEGEPKKVVSVNADPSALFAIASITKVMTATLVLQHVQRGDIGLDDPIIDHLPTLRLDPPEAAGRVTVRHLLTHSAGIDCADDLTDTGDQANCLELFVDEAISGSRLFHEPGTMWSYSNCGFTLLGRLVEVLDNRTWEESLNSRIFEPVGLAATISGRAGSDRVVAVGHRFDTDRQTVVEEPHLSGCSGGPAGSNTLATAEDLIDFAHALLCGGGLLLDRDLVIEMTRPQLPMARGFQALGWSLPSFGRLVHLGATGGFTAFLSAVPSEHAIAVVANGEGAEVIAAAVEEHLFGTIANPVRATNNAAPIDPLQCVGRYERRHAAQEVTFTGGTLRASTSFSGPLANFLPDPPDVELVSIGGAHFETPRRPDQNSPTVWEFSDFSVEGRPSLLLTSNRLHRRAPARPMTAEI